MNWKICYLGAIGRGARLIGGRDMTNGFAKDLIVAGLAATVVIGLGARPGLAHNDWGLPLVGGLVGGAGLTALYYNSQRHDEPRTQVVQQPVYVTPAAAPVVAATPAVPTASTIEQQLNVLDQLAAKGYITPAEYQARRQALLDQL
jgi:hypothetical protein